MIMHVNPFSMQMPLLLLSETTRSSSYRLRHMKLRRLSHRQLMLTTLSKWCSKITALRHRIASTFSNLSEIWNLSIEHHLQLHLLILVLQILQHLIIDCIHFCSITTQSRLGLTMVAIKILKVSKLGIIFQKHVELIVIALAVRITVRLVALACEI